jgi:hypothetical protein
VGNKLEGLVDPGPGQLVVHAVRLAQAVARVPDDIVYRLPRRLGVDEVVHDRPAPMGASRHERKAGDHAGDLVGPSCRCCWSSARHGLGPPNGARSRYRGRRAENCGRTVTGPGIGAHGVALAALRAYP